MKVGFYTLGCKVNLYETNYMISLFKKEGFTIEDFSNPCDIYVINTCTVTNQSDAKSRKMINQARKNNPNAILVVCGCFVESAKNKGYNFDNVDIIIGNKDKSKVVSLVKEYLTKTLAIDVSNHEQLTIFEDMEITHFEGKTRAFVKIQDGCENYCSYCIIPFVRGKCRSKSPTKVLEEITSLVNKGYKEIVLTGIHTGNYGCDINTNFSSLLKQILEIKSLKRLRISSIEITELDEEFLKLLKNKIICNHLHIPLQSGSNKTLKNMNRKYTKEEYIKKVQQIRKVRPDISLTTDVIVGFPGESIDDYNESIATIRKIGFSKIHVFPYSKRDNTKASYMKDQLPNDVKKQRSRNLIMVSNELEKAYQQKCLGKEEQILIEKIIDNYAYGHTTNYLYLKIPNNDYKENEIYPVTVKEEYFDTTNNNVTIEV